MIENIALGIVLFGVFLFSFLAMKTALDYQKS